MEHKNEHFLSTLRLHAMDHVLTDDCEQRGKTLHLASMDLTHIYNFCFN